MKPKFNRSVWLKAMNQVRDDCEVCPFVKKKGLCPGGLHNDSDIRAELTEPRLAVCTRAVYNHMMKKL